VLFQILLATLRHTYYLAERKFFFSVYQSLLELNESHDLERAQLGLFLIIMKILNFYDLVSFPLTCQVCGANMYQGNFDFLGFYCDEHKAKNGTDFSLFSNKERIDFLKTMLQEFLNVTVTFNPGVITK